MNKKAKGQFLKNLAETKVLLRDENYFSRTSFRVKSLLQVMIPFRLQIQFSSASFKDLCRAYVKMTSHRTDSAEEVILLLYSSVRRTIEQNKIK